MYAGLAGFYVLRDEVDTGEPGNELNLPTYPYEAAFAIQDRMFKENGELFYPAFQGDPAYEDFITNEGAEWNGEEPTALAEFFGNYMVVNGKIWPKMAVDRRMYRLRLLNGCDSRFLVLEFYKVTQDTKSWTNGERVPFDVIGSDQGIGPPKGLEQLVMGTGSRYDILLDFSGFTDENVRIIMVNRGGDEPFGGDIPGPSAFDFTDRIMAFDVVGPPEDYPTSPDYNTMLTMGVSLPVPTNVRRLGLFEGRDEHGRLQPLLGTLEGPNPGTRTWDEEPITEQVKKDEVEEWQIFNFSGDAHPIHLHLVHFEITGRYRIPKQNVFAEERLQVQYNGENGVGYDVHFVEGQDYMGEQVDPNEGQPGPYAEAGFRKDIVIALPDQITTIVAKFDKPGRYVWHCVSTSIVGGQCRADSVLQVVAHSFKLLVPALLQQ